jgi:hypothetical protein
LLTSAVLPPGCHLCAAATLDRIIADTTGSLSS